LIPELNGAWEVPVQVLTPLRLWDNAKTRTGNNYGHLNHWNKNEEPALFTGKS
jgi:hypothetical protein